MGEPKQETDKSDDRGCVFIIGIVIIGIAIGNIFSAGAGWLVIGLGLVFVALL